MTDETMEPDETFNDPGPVTAVVYVRGKVHKQPMKFPPTRYFLAHLRYPCQPQGMTETGDLCNMEVVKCEATRVEKLVCNLELQRVTGKPAVEYMVYYEECER